MLVRFKVTPHSKLIRKDKELGYVCRVGVERCISFGLLERVRCNYGVLECRKEMRWECRERLGLVLRVDALVSSAAV